VSASHDAVVERSGVTATWSGQATAPHAVRCCDGRRRRPERPEVELVKLLRTAVPQTWPLNGLALRTDSSDCSTYHSVRKLRRHLLNRPTER